MEKLKAASPSVRWAKGFEQGQELGKWLMNLREKAKGQIGERIASCGVLIVQSTDPADVAEDVCKSISGMDRRLSIEEEFLLSLQLRPLQASAPAEMMKKIRNMLATKSSCNLALFDLVFVYCSPEFKPQT